MGIVAAYAVPHPPLAMPEVGRGQERAIQDTLDAYREVARPRQSSWCRPTPRCSATASICPRATSTAATWGASAHGTLP